MEQNIKVFLLEKEMYPYRLLLYDKLAKKFNLTVYFCEEKSFHRLWEVKLLGYSFRGIVGKRWYLGPIIINYDLLTQLRKHHFDVYIISSVGIQTLLSALVTFIVSKIRNKPLLYWTGFFNTEYYTRTNPWKKRLGDLTRKFFGSHANACIAYGKETENYFYELGINKNKVYSGTQVMPIELLQTPKEKLNDLKGKYAGKKFVLTVSYFQKRKGINVLILAFQKLNDPSSVLLIAGTGSEENNLKQLAQGDTNIYFLGYIEGEEKAKYYSLADIFVLPTFYDPWGLVINEAMYYGLPIITTENAGAKELIKDNGIIVKPGDIEELRKAMKRLLNDENLRKQMGKKSREIIENYDIGSVVNIFIKAINDLHKREL